jgi:hypothetical protein
VGEPADDLTPLLGPVPAGVPDPARRERAYRTTAGVLRRGRWVRRGWVGVMAAGLFAGGGVVGWVVKPTPTPEVVRVTVPEPPPSEPPPVIVPPVEPTPLTAEQLELRAELADEPAEAARLFREAGDKFLAARDFENAARCYRRHLHADPNARTPSTSDSWLLMTLKLPNQ